MPSESSPSSTSKRKLTAHYRRIDVEVTQEHIDTAIPSDSAHCMIADAIRAAVPQAKKIAVDLQAIRFTDPEKGQRYVYFTPTIGQDALIAFDEGTPIKPFSFTLRSPIQVIAAGTRQKGESRAFEGMRTTTSSKLGVQVGGEPLPQANLYWGPGHSPSAEKYARITETEEAVAPPTTRAETAPITEENRPDSRIPQPEPVTEENRPTGQIPDAHPVAEEFRKNVTLSTGRGRRRQYGMHQLRPVNIPRLQQP